MNIQPISASAYNVQAFQGKKNNSNGLKKDNNILTRALILTGALSAAAISGILLIKHKKFPQSILEHTKNMKENLRNKHINKKFEFNVKRGASSIKKSNKYVNITVLPLKKLLPRHLSALIL